MEYNFANKRLIYYGFQPRHMHPIQILENDLMISVINELKLPSPNLDKLDSYLIPNYMDIFYHINLFEYPLSENTIEWMYARSYLKPDDGHYLIHLIERMPVGREPWIILTWMLRKTWIDALLNCYYSLQYTNSVTTGLKRTVYIRNIMSQVMSCRFLQWIYPESLEVLKYLESVGVSHPYGTRSDYGLSNDIDEDPSDIFQNLSLT